MFTESGIFLAFRVACGEWRSQAVARATAGSLGRAVRFAAKRHSNVAAAQRSRRAARPRSARRRRTGSSLAKQFSCNYRAARGFLRTPVLTHKYWHLRGAKRPLCWRVGLKRYEHSPKSTGGKSAQSDATQASETLQDPSQHSEQISETANCAFI